MFAADETAVADKEGLHDCIGICDIVLPRNAQNILVLADILGHLLFLRDHLHTADEIAVLRGLFEIKSFRGCIHLCSEIIDQRLIFSGQKFDDLIDPRAVLFLGDSPRQAGSTAAVDMVIDARTLFPDIARQHAIAVPKLKHPVQQLHRGTHRITACERPEILCSVLFHLTHHEKPRIRLVHGHLDVRIGFVVDEHRVVLGPVLLNEIVLENQCLELGIRDNVLEVRNLADHALDLRPAPDNFLLKIRAHAVVQILRLADVENRVLRIVHDVNAGLLRELLQLIIDDKMLFCCRCRLCCHN